ncbi:MAG: hypothetical protein ACU0A6_13570 [Shimia sp.]|uniref:hypothetical protein n=1 Tax=Shimia sp. TaxID=1954381 RepID=UPI00405976DC
MALVLTPALRVEEQDAETSEDQSETEFLEEQDHGHSTPEALDVSEFEAEADEAFDLSEQGDEDDAAFAEEADENEDDIHHDDHDHVEDGAASDGHETSESDEDSVEAEIDAPYVDEETHEAHNEAHDVSLEHADEVSSEDVFAIADNHEQTSEDHAAGAGADEQEEAGFVEIEDSDEDNAGIEEPFDFKKVLEARLVHWRDGDENLDARVEDEPVDSDYAETSADDWGVEAPLETPSTQPAYEGVIHTIETQVHDEVAEEIVAVAADADLGESLEDPAVIDEEVLREMVADIVRQELQGALGERITRNVRKLVRREIHRALAAHDLD